MKWKRRLAGRMWELPARGVMRSGDVLILDEPTFGQDARTWAELVALLGRVRDEGSAVVTITHDLDVVEALGADSFVLGGSS